MHEKKKWRIIYHLRDNPLVMYAEATGENAREALQLFYRTHDDPEIIVTSCKAAKE